MNDLFLENISDQLRWVGSAFFRFSTICTAIYDILLLALKHCHRKFTLWVHSITCSSFWILFWYNQTTFFHLVHGREIIENPPPTLYFGTPCPFCFAHTPSMYFLLRLSLDGLRKEKQRTTPGLVKLVLFLFKFFRPEYLLKLELRKY